MQWFAAMANIEVAHLAFDAARDDPLGRALAQQYARFIAEEEFSAWMSTLKEKYPVEINKAALESKDR